MRKLLPFLLIISAISFALLGNSKATNNGILLKDYSDTSLLKESLQLDATDPVNEIIILPEGTFDEEKAAISIQHLQKLPHSLLVKIHENDIFIKLFNGNLTDNPTAQHLRGLSPRGYESDKKWDELPGIGGGELVLIKIGHSEKGMGHGAVNLELHELAHSIDRILYDGLRYHPLFLDIWLREKYTLFKERPYFTTWAEEYFAECFAMFYVNDEHNTLLKERAPETYEFIKNLQ